MDQIVSLVEAHDLWGKVTSFSLESQAELGAAYRYLSQRQSVFALTALYEPFGLAPMEAMSCGLPAVVTRNGGPSESLREGDREYGVLVDPADPQDVAGGLLRLVGSEPTWQAFRQAGIERVLSRYTWDRTAQGYAAVLESLLQSPVYPGQEPVPDYFTAPGPMNAPPVTELERLYFG
jgi:sucrose-phosphate synthase